MSIPTNLEEAIEGLWQTLSATQIKEFSLMSEEDLSLAHHSLGTWIRNHWGLWQGGPLLDYMTSLGFIHPDDMSSSIIREFWARLHNLPSTFQQDIQAYKQWWDQQDESAI